MILTRRSLLQLGLAAGLAPALRASGQAPATASPAGRGAAAPDAVARVLAYHELSKHRPDRSAPAPETIPWDEQPDAFRRYEGAPLLALDEVAAAAAPSWDAVAAGAVPAEEIGRASLSRLLAGSLAISAWKESGRSRWPLRVNPSSGNLHPVEAYLAGGPFPGLTEAPALLHHAPLERALERRGLLPAEVWRAIAARLPPRAFLVALTAIPWREAWKYGERGWRYTLLDVGHALAAVAVAAAALGWRARVLEAWTDADIARLTGVDRQSGHEAERAAVVLAVWPGEPWDAAAERAAGLPEDAAAALASVRLEGTPAPLGGSEYVEWPASVAAAEAAVRVAPPGEGFWGDGVVRRPPDGERGLSARAVVRGRRTALGFDRSAAASQDELFRVLGRTLPAATPAVFGALPWRPWVQLTVLVHRVEGLAPGVYLVPRDAASARERFGGLEEAVEGAAVPLLRVVERDVRAAARAAGCDQDVAADGAFTVAMIAPVEELLREHGAPVYRTIHHEAGAVGQALYLEAEAVGLRGTAMGCFVDDSLLRVVGLEGSGFQVIHTLAVGRGVGDGRVTRLP